MDFFSVNGLRIAYRVDGPDDAPTLVLVNSLGTDLRMWDLQIAHLKQDLRIVRYDCRGHGGSSVSTEPYTVSQLGQDLLALLDTLQLARVYICGISLGGMIALWLASQHPQRTARAIFANTAARIGTEAIWNTRIDAVKNGGMAAIRAAVLARFLSEPFRQRHPEVTQQIGDMLTGIDPSGYIGTCAAIRDTDLRTMVPAINVPSLIIAGSLDKSTPPSQAQELHAAIAGSELVTFQDVAHLSNIEEPRAFSEHVLRFLTAPT